MLTHRIMTHPIAATFSMECILECDCCIRDTFVREELEKAKAREEYFRRYKEGESEDAKRDMERLAQVKKQREAAAKAREEEKRCECTGGNDMK